MCTIGEHPNSVDIMTSFGRLEQLSSIVRIMFSLKRLRVVCCLHMFFITFHASRADEDPQCSNDADILIKRVLHMLQTKYAYLVASNSTSGAKKFSETVDSMKHRLLNEPLRFYNYLQETINFEREIFNWNSFNVAPNSEIDGIGFIMRTFSSWILSIDENARRIDENPNHPDHFMFLNKMKLLVNLNETIYLKLSDCLNRWRRYQKTNQRDSTFYNEESLYKIENWFFAFRMIVEITDSCLTRLFSIGHDLSTRKSQISDLLKRMRRESIFFKVQPPQVLQKGAK